MNNDNDPLRAEGATVDDDFDIDAELGFEPAVSATGATESHGPRKRRASRRAKAQKVGKPDKPARKPRGARPGAARRRRLRRRLGATAVLAAALLGTGGVYAAFAGTPNSSNADASSTDVHAGQQLYETSCITCHGANLQGVKDRAPSLIGVGAASVYFQVTTGRMPATGQAAEMDRKTAKFTEKQAQQLAAYVQSVAGGPVLPDGSLRDADIAEGGNLFRLNCASCHGATGKGAPLSAGKNAPSLNESTDKQIYAAMLSGPESMPVFSDNQITPEQKREIISYIQTLKASQDPGGHGIDRIGPVSEAIVIWVAGVGALMIAILWIGAKVE